MSRIGKTPIEIPGGVTVDVKDRVVHVKGPLGEGSQKLFDNITIDINGNVLQVKAENYTNNKEIAAYFGLARTLINNLVMGVSKGFIKELEIHGVGYRATQKNADIEFQLGYSHTILFKAPEGIKLEVVEATKLKVIGADKQQVGQIAANIRKLRPPEPYKGKGIRYKNEQVRKKAGKAGKA